ncbi:hypothetical protein ES703_117998 [subsurface metagenome]
MGFAQNPRLGRNFTMGRMDKQRRTKHRPELSIPPVSLQEIGTPVLKQPPTPEGILIRFPDRNRSGSPRFVGAASVSISTLNLSCPLELPLSSTSPIGQG